MKCSRCNSIDSMATYMYIDKNNNLLTESEFTAFTILHPEAGDATLKKVILCGICYARLDKEPNRKVKIVQKSMKTSSSVRTKEKANHYYICPFCHTPNEPLHNTCKKCMRILFSTEYETKRVSKHLIHKEKKNNLKLKNILPIIVILLVALYIFNEYEGQSINNNLEGLIIDSKVSNQQSTYEWPDGSMYTGDFENGKPNGKGTLKWVNGNTYTGDFLDGEITGQGKLEWVNGTVYEGVLLKGKPQGQGTMNYPDGSTYSGLWINGEPE